MKADDLPCALRIEGRHEQMGTTVTGDPRDVALRNAVYSVI